MTDRLTRWEGADENGPRAVLANHNGRFPDVLQEALRKLAKFEDEEEPIPLPPVFGKPMTDEEIAEWVCEEIRKDIRRCLGKDLPDLPPSTTSYEELFGNDD